MSRQNPARSSIEQLPADVLEALHELLRDPRVSQLEATRRINDLLAELGTDERLSKSAVNRYALRMEEVGARLRQAREMAQMWSDKLGTQAADSRVSRLVVEVIRALSFDLSLKLDAGLPGLSADDPEALRATMATLRDLALTVQRLEQAESASVDREMRVKKTTLEEAAARVEQGAQARGLSAEDARFWREQVLRGGG